MIRKRKEIVKLEQSELGRRVSAVVVMVWEGGWQWREKEERSAQISKKINHTLSDTNILWIHIHELLELLFFKKKF